MSLLELSLMFIQAYCEKHDTCATCRMYSRHKGCAIQRGDVPSLWDIKEMVKGEK